MSAASSGAEALDPALRLGIWFGVAAWVTNRLQTIDRNIENNTRKPRALRAPSSSATAVNSSGNSNTDGLPLLPWPYPYFISRSVLWIGVIQTLIALVATQAIYSIVILDGGSSFYFLSIIIHVLTIEGAVLWSYLFYTLRMHICAMVSICASLFGGVVANLAFVSTQSARATLLMIPLLVWIGTVAFNSSMYSLTQIRAQSGLSSSSDKDSSSSSMQLPVVMTGTTQPPPPLTAASSQSDDW